MAELLSPAGNPEKLRAAIRFGADAVYFAGKSFGMRSAADNFTVEEIYEASSYVHERGKKLYLTVNTLPRPDEYPMLERYLCEIADAKLDGFIVADPGVMTCIKRNVKDAEIHISTQAGVVSHESCNFWYSQGVRRVVLAREMSFEDIKRIRELKEFKVPEYDGYYMILKAYLVYEGVCYAEVAEEFIFWSEETVDAFATDLEWKSATIGWGSIRKDKSVGGNTLRLAGKKFDHGIGTHANSEIVMDIPEGAKKFLAVAGCDLEMSGMNTMMFFVYVDGELIDSSSLIKIGQHYVFDIDIPEGAKEIKLFAYEGTYGGNTNDHADWTVAAFFKDIELG